jgi:DNA-binding LytR/AlgR family response regulator
MGWRGNPAHSHTLPPTRGLTARSTRAPGPSRPCRTADHSKSFARWTKTPFPPPAPPPLPSLLEGFCPEPRPDEWLAVNANGRLLFLQLGQIDWLEAADNRVALHVGQETHLLDDTLAALAGKLPPGRFLRISPSALVNLERIKVLRPLCQGEWRVQLRNGARLTLTRGYGEHLQQAGWFLTAPVKPLLSARLRRGRPARR